MKIKQFETCVWMRSSPKYSNLKHLGGRQLNRSETAMQNSSNKTEITGILGAALSGFYRVDPLYRSLERPYSREYRVVTLWPEKVFSDALQPHVL